MTGWHEDFGDSPAVEETKAYQNYLLHTEAPMTDDKILEVVALYRGELPPFDGERGPIQLPWPEWSQEQKIKHLVYVLDQIEAFVKEGRRDKAFRWLGFIQGVLTAQGFYTIEDCGNHNKPPLADRINELRQKLINGQGFDHNVTNEEAAHVRSWISRVTGIPLQEEDIWVRNSDGSEQSWNGDPSNPELVQIESDTLLFGYVTRNGEVAMNRMTEIMSSGQPYEQMPSLDPPELELSPE